MNKLDQLAKLGQAAWLDFVLRSFIHRGELEGLVNQGLRGVTSNPTIFENAISGSNDYDSKIINIAKIYTSAINIYEYLAIEDIRSAADILRPVYEKTIGADGYVSLEVNPHLAHDTDGTVAEAARLFNLVGRPNLMIKIPATAAGFRAIELTISKGINVNVTLIFSRSQYENAAHAFLAGLDKLLSDGGDISKVASVASLFVSRLDTAVDRQLDAQGNTELLGKIAIANAKIVYTRFKEIFSGSHWEKLVKNGAHCQRPLWASTGTKNPAYTDTLYVDNLIGPYTVNTLPPATLHSFIDHGKLALTLETALDEARAQLAQLAGYGISLDAITQQLQDDGINAFTHSFESLLASIKNKCLELSGIQLL